jgi:hypothetical protein
MRGEAMSKSPDLTIYVAAQNAEDYAEVFLRSAAQHGESRLYHLTMSILVGDSSDNTLGVCRAFAPNLPFKCRVRSLDELSDDARSEIRAVVDCNDGVFSEGIWDWLVNENLEQSTYYAGMHVDISFHRSGLWDELLTNLITTGSDVAGIFAAGELLTTQGTKFMTPPRLFPVVAVCHRERARALGVRWSRPCSTSSRRDRLIVDNGTLALEALIGNQAVALGATFLPVTMDYLEEFIEHFGFLWTQNVSSSVHEHDGERSRERVRAELSRYSSLASAAPQTYQTRDD